MRVFVPGYIYELDSLDGPCEQTLTFVKREGDKYPGNVGTHPGTNVQDVLRALIDRVKYLDGQISCAENKQVLIFLRESLFALERRAAQRHNRYFSESRVDIENRPTCATCGHIGCGGTCR